MLTASTIFVLSPTVISSTDADLDCSGCLLIPRWNLEVWLQTRDPVLLERRHAPHHTIQLCTACGCYYPPEEYAGRDFRGPHFKGERSVCTACTFDGGGWHK